jgi:hypothetical protein
MARLIFNSFGRQEDLAELRIRDDSNGDADAGVVQTKFF